MTLIVIKYSHWYTLIRLMFLLIKSLWMLVSYLETKFTLRMFKILKRYQQKPIKSWL